MATSAQNTIYATKTINPKLTPSDEADFLDNDTAIRGQNYVCMSFLSPEEVIKRKEVFFFEKFQESLSKDLVKVLADLKAKYPDDLDGLNYIEDRNLHFFDPEQLQAHWLQFVQNSQGLEQEYYEKNNFQTSIRGIKVRGVFDTLKEAQVRCEVLKRRDTRHNIFIAQMGCWCPWSPNPDDIQDQKFAETHLNTVMEKYQENQVKKDMFFEERKNELKSSAVKKGQSGREATLDIESASAAASTLVVEDADEDPWLKRQSKDAHEDVESQGDSGL